jgi:hypothetical protein
VAAPDVGGSVGPADPGAASWTAQANARTSSVGEPPTSRSPPLGLGATRANSRIGGS